jgi:hypothetical protein
MSLDLTEREDPSRAALLLQYGKALRTLEDPAAAGVLEEAEHLHRAAGDIGHAAEAALLLGEIAWFAGDGVVSGEHLERAAAMTREEPPSSSKAYVLGGMPAQLNCWSVRDPHPHSGKSCLQRSLGAAPPCDPAP